MTSRRACLGLLLVSLLSTSCRRTSAPEPEPEPEAAPSRSAYAKQLRTAPEALTWLRANPHPSALASNRFGPTHAAIEFVESLYARGATRVVVVNMRPEEGAEYADAIVIALPEDDAARASFLDDMRAEAARGGYTLGPEVKDGVLFMWWD